MSRSGGTTSFAPRREPRDITLDTSTPVVVLATGHVGHGIARSLGRLGAPLYAVHADGRSPAARSRYWRQTFSWDIRAEEPEKSIAWLTGLAGQIGGRPILIPTGDPSCLFLADNAAELSGHFLFPDQPAGLARRLSDKREMYFLCKEYSIPTPETLFPASRRDVENFLDNVSFPLMLKGVDTEALRRRTGVGMVVVHDARSLLQHYDELELGATPTLMLQEYIPGGAENIWMFDGYFDARSTCLFCLTGQKIRQYPPYTGLTSLGICVENQEVVIKTTGLLKRLGYRGIVDLGYKYDARSGQYKLLDVNPRIGTTFRLFVDRAGMDVVRAMYLDLTGQPVHTGPPPEGRKWMVENFDLLASLRYLRDGQFTIPEWVGSFRGVEEASWFSRDDLMPFLAMWARSLEWALGRASDTKNGQRSMTAGPASSHVHKL